MKKYISEKLGPLYAKKDKTEFEKALNTVKDRLTYATKYGISVDDIDTKDTVNINYYITVPGHSELKSNSDFEMAGLYLGNQFKDYIKNTSDESSKLRIKIHCSINENKKWTEADSISNLERLANIYANDDLYPYREYSEI